MIQTRPRAYEIRSVYIALAIKRAIERASSTPVKTEDCKTGKGGSDAPGPVGDDRGRTQWKMDYSRPVPRKAVTDARIWHPWLRINRVLRAMPHERWSADAWPQVKVEFKKTLALKSQIRCAGWFN
jgi:hypothetical protein